MKVLLLKMSEELSTVLDTNEFVNIVFIGQEISLNEG